MAFLANLSVKQIEFAEWEKQKQGGLEQLLDDIARYTERFEKTPEEEQFIKFNNYTTMMMIFASNKYEGSKISKGETFRILSSWQGKSLTEMEEYLAKEPIQASKRSNPPSSREVLQHYIAYKILCETNQDLTEDLIKSAHKVLMTGLLDDSGLAINEGTYRTEPIGARNTVFMDPSLVPESMTRLVADFNAAVSNNKIDTALLAGWLMCQFLTIHPFNDGNGRISRLLWHLALRKRGMRITIPIVGEGKNKKYMASVKQYQKYPMDTNRKLGAVWYFSADYIAKSWANFYTSYSRADIV